MFSLSSYHKNYISFPCGLITKTYERCGNAGYALRCSINMNFKSVRPQRRSCASHTTAKMFRGVVKLTENVKNQLSSSWCSQMLLAFFWRLSLHKKLLVALEPRECRFFTKSSYYSAPHIHQKNIRPCQLFHSGKAEVLSESTPHAKKPLLSDPFAAVNCTHSIRTSFFVPKFHCFESSPHALPVTLKFSW